MLYYLIFYYRRFNNSMNIGETDRRNKFNHLLVFSVFLGDDAIL